MDGKLAIVYLFWVLITTCIVIITSQINSEDRCLYAGFSFILASSISFLSIHSYFASAFQCHLPQCWKNKVIAESIANFLSITWGTFGGSLLAHSFILVKVNHRSLKSMAYIKWFRLKMEVLFGFY